MSIQEAKETVTDTDIDENAREYWKQQALIRGITYPVNITTDKLKDLVKKHIAEKEVEIAGNYRGRKEIQMIAPEVRTMIDDATRLVRFKLEILDPNKQSWTGMYVSAGNENLPAIRKFIPFNAEVWHAEQIIINVLKGMRYVVRPSQKHNRTGVMVDNIAKPKVLPSFRIIELPMLNNEELAELARQQQINGTGMSEDDILGNMM